MHDIAATAHAAREASFVLAGLDSAAKNALLGTLAEMLRARRPEVLDANAQDCAEAAAAGLPGAKLARLALTPAGLDGLARGVDQIAALPDPVGEVVEESRGPSGIAVRRVRVPLGVVCMIYEARPGVNIDAFALCFKAGNAVILKGGREAARSNAALQDVVRAALAAHRLPMGAMTAIRVNDRESLKVLLAQAGSIDLVIPRGGEELIRFVAEHSRIATIQHYRGVCHLYVDASADLEMALRVCVSAKTAAPATCNAAECVLVHQAAAPAFVPALARGLAAAGVEIRADEEARAMAPGLKAARGDDFGREFLDLTIALRVVLDVDEAIGHIQRHGSRHTEAVLARDDAVVRRFLRGVDASCVVVNASTRMNDGGALGLGAEIGISTSKLHAYGPMGLRDLTIPRYEVRGEGQTR